MFLLFYHGPGIQPNFSSIKIRGILIHQTLRIYKCQCSKAPQIKEKVRFAHAELVERGFMTKVSDLPLYLQEFIKAADRNHYYCWRVVYKEDSPDKLTVAKAEFSALEKAGIICHSTSPWSSALHMVKKQKGGLRPCGDYRLLNTVTIPDWYPLPNTYRKLQSSFPSECLSF